MILDDADSSVMSAQASIMNRTSLFSTSNEAAETNQLNLSILNSSLSTLQLRLQQALKAAAMVSIIS